VTPQGNAYRIALPAGATITFAASAHLETVRAVAVNETRPDGDRALVLTAPLQLVSPAYIAERDAAEVRYVRRIIELEQQAK
jgi:hypothetical protein